MRWPNELTIIIGMVGTTIAVIAGAVWFAARPTAGSPPISREELVRTNTAVKGAQTAKVTLVEFSDFQCPACKAFVPVVEELTTTYKDKLLFVYRHFPLDQHPFGRAAAAAAEAAGLQGKFWDMAALLFANQERFSPTLWGELADKLNLDRRAFDQAMKSAEIDQKIQEDRSMGLRIGVRATPTFFLNGEKLEAQTFEEFKKKVQEAIRQSEL